MGQMKRMIESAIDSAKQIAGDTATESWYDFTDVIEDAKSEARETIYAQIEQVLLDADMDMDLEDLEEMFEEYEGESLDSYIDDMFYSEWEV